MSQTQKIHSCFLLLFSRRATANELISGFSYHQPATTNLGLTTYNLELATDLLLFPTTNPLPPTSVLFQQNRFHGERIKNHYGDIKLFVAEFTLNEWTLQRDLKQLSVDRLFGR